jgi:hypothetical protein
VLRSCRQKTRVGAKARPYRSAPRFRLLLLGTDLLGSASGHSFAALRKPDSVCAITRAVPRRPHDSLHVGLCRGGLQARPWCFDHVGRKRGSELKLDPTGLRRVSARSCSALACSASGHSFAAASRKPNSVCAITRAVPRRPHDSLHAFVGVGFMPLSLRS